jgi:hypothetical protein
MMNRVKNLLSNDNVNLSNWEQGFLDSILSQLNRRHTLSAKQVQMIQKIEGRVEKFNRDYPAWAASWDDTKEQHFSIAVAYYKKQDGGRYFRNIWTKREADPKYIPSEEEYKKLTENKYVKRVIGELTGEAKFSPGQTVQIRANATNRQVGINWSEWAKLQKTPMFIIGLTGTVASAAKGAKEYKVLPAGWASTLTIQERHLKKSK